MQNTPEHDEARAAFRAKRNILLTGQAGSGKTTLIREFIEQWYMDMKVTGTTGMSAIQYVNGSTLHSALHIPINFPAPPEIEQMFAAIGRKFRRCPSDPKLLWVGDFLRRSILLIDEISMCSAYLLEIVDIICRVLRRDQRPMGGMQVILIGDFLQLPPVFDNKDPKVNSRQGLLAFESPVWTALNLKVILLQKIFRQDDPNYQRLLHCIRWNLRMSEKDALLMNGLMHRDVSDASMKKKLEDLFKETGMEALIIKHKKDDVRSYNENKMANLNVPADQMRTYPFPYAVQCKRDEQEFKYLMNQIRDGMHMRHNETQHTFSVGALVMLTRNNEYLCMTPDSQPCEICLGQGFDESGAPCIHCLGEGVFMSACVQCNGCGMICSTPDDGKECLECKGHGRVRPPPTGRRGGELVKLVNGDTGTILRFTNVVVEEKNGTVTYTGCPVVRFMRDGKEYATVTVLPVLYTRSATGYDGAGELKDVVVASVSVIPLILAWAITTHKCQGITVSGRPIVIFCDMMNWIENSFYVAFSRASKLSQITLINFKGYKQSQKGIDFYQNRFALPAAGLLKLTLDFDTEDAVIEKIEKKQEEKKSIFPPRILEPAKEEVKIIDAPMVRSAYQIREHFRNDIKPTLDTFFEQNKGVRNVKRRKDEAVIVIEEWLAELKNH